MTGARVLALSLALASPLRAQTGVVSLLVLDGATDSAVPGVWVSIVGQAGESVTDADGRSCTSPHMPGAWRLSCAGGVREYAPHEPLRPHHGVDPARQMTPDRR